MIHVLKTGAFSKWFEDVSDGRAKARIQIRIDRISLGLIGDAKFFDGIGELRIDYGPGYRVYFIRHGKGVVILLGGGVKKTQRRDIAAAIALAKEISQ